MIVTDAIDLLYLNMPCSIRSLYPRNFFFFILNKMLPISSKIKSNLWLSFDLIIIFRLYVHYTLTTSIIFDMS